MNPVATAKPSARVFLGSHHEVRKVRAFVAEAVYGCPVADDVILLASEAATNAVVHTASGKGGTFTVVVRPDDRMIRVEVHDSGSETSPEVRAPGELAGSGRGLGLVESLATRWGHLGDRNGRVVWFEVEWQMTAGEHAGRSEARRLETENPLWIVIQNPSDSPVHVPS